MDKIERFEDEHIRYLTEMSKSSNLSADNSEGIDSTGPNKELE
jgi:hypothetical protein